MTLFRSSHELATLSVTLNIIGVATAPMIFAPLSEIFGRRPIYVVAGALYSLCCIMASESTGIAMLLSTRLLAGFFGAVSVTLVPASIADYTRLENRNRYTIVCESMVHAVDTSLARARLIRLSRSMLLISPFLLLPSFFFSGSCSLDRCCIVIHWSADWKSSRSFCRDCLSWS